MGLSRKRKPIKWFHIMDKQPKNGEVIVQIDTPYEGHYPMGMRRYVQDCSFEDLLDFHRKYLLADPNFHWMLAKNFPFPT